MTLDTLRGLHLAFTDRPRKAAESLDLLRTSAPLSANLRRKLGFALAMRGLRVESGAEYRTARALEPESVGAELGLANNLLAGWRWAPGEDRLEELQLQFPENVHVQQSVRSAELRHRWLLEAESWFESGNQAASVVGNVEVRTRWALWSPAFLVSYRAFVEILTREAELGEVLGEDRRLAVGVRWREGNRWAQVAIHEGRFARLVGTRASSRGWSASCGARLGSHWRLEAGFAEGTDSIPLRALLHDIQGSKAHVEASYRASERLSATVSLARTDFDDGNRRWELTSTWLGEAYAGRVYRLQGGMEAAASRSPDEGRPYFNPTSDQTVLAVLSQEWLGHRWYERRLTHRFVVKVGLYDQDALGPGPVGGLRYEHDWRLTPEVGLRYGVQWRSWVYDGERERRVRPFASLSLHLP